MLLKLFAQSLFLTMMVKVGTHQCDEAASFESQTLNRMIVHCVECSDVVYVIIKRMIFPLR